MLGREFQINKKTIEIQQNLDYGHAGSVWDAALVFAHYLEKNMTKLTQKQFFYEKSILELGSGTGVAGLLTATFNPKKVVLTDMEVNQQLLTINIQNNLKNIDKNVILQNSPLEWGKENKDKLEKFILEQGVFDIVLGSDLMYDDANSLKLLETFQDLSMLIPGCLFMLVFNIRKESEREIIKQIERDYECEHVNEQEFDETYRDEDIGILLFRKADKK